MQERKKPTNIHKSTHMRAQRTLLALNPGVEVAKELMSVPSEASGHIPITSKPSVQVRAHLASQRRGMNE